MFGQAETMPALGRSMVCHVPALKGPDGSGVVEHSKEEQLQMGRGLCDQAVTRD